MLAGSVPHLLIAKQKQACLTIAMEHLVRFHREEVFLKCIVAIHKSRTGDFEPELKSQSAKWQHHSSLHSSDGWFYQQNIKLRLTQKFSSAKS